MPEAGTSDSARTPWKMRARHRIEFEIITETPLHAGDGGSAAMRTRLENMRAAGADVGEQIATLDKRSKHDPEFDPRYATVLRAQATPCISGSTLKGCLRAWLSSRMDSRKMVEGLFGPPEIRSKEDDPEAHKIPAGKLTILTSRLTSPGPVAEPYRWWDVTMSTAVEPCVSIDPETRTAANKLLYWQEFVPEGSKFRCVIEGAGLKAEELGWLTRALRSALRGGSDTLQLGASGADGWGRVKLVEGTLQTSISGPEELKAWWKTEASLREAPKYNSIETATGTLDLPNSATIRIEVTLHFEGAVLVNDPSRARRRGREDDAEAVAHAFIRKLGGAYYIPASSIRGALRGQASRIWRTLAGGKATPEKQVRRLEDLRDLPPFQRVFGAAGWKSPIQITNFELASKEDPHHQEFVAVDRFTGGAAPQRKFAAEALLRPVFKGTITLDPKRFEFAGVGKWAWLLLVFLLRDLKEGDVYFGAGRSKGYGAVEDADIEISGLHPEVGLLQGVLARSEAALNDPRLAEYGSELDKVA